MWGLRWRVAASRRRLFIWNILVPVLLLLPVAFSRAAAPHRAAIVSVFVVLFGTFGSCIPLVRDRARGWNQKVWLTGYRSRPWLTERIAAATTLDLAELTPALLLLFLGAGLGSATGAEGFVSALPAVALALLAANLLGALVAAFVASIAEATLVCGATALYALHFSGVFRSADPDSWVWYVERAAPFRPLVTMLREALSGGTAGQAPYDWVGPLIATAVLALVTLSVAARLAREVPHDV